MFVDASASAGLEQIAFESALKAFKEGSGASFLKALSALDRFLHSGCAFQLISFSGKGAGNFPFRFYPSRECKIRGSSTREVLLKNLAFVILRARARARA